ncbi:MAG: LysR family transcriptional regulator [Bacteroidales bacterium]|nr:LysR family transcriptional regulator [Bacteroidales bacterium]
MLEDFRLKVFLALAAEKSFTEAAKKLGISQPAVSQNIAELEKGLGVKLFQRLHGETVLSPEGEIFRRYAEKILLAASDAELMFSPMDVPSVRIAASADIYTYYILPSIKGFMTVHPEVAIDLVSSDDDHDVLVTLRPCADGEDPSDLHIVFIPKQAFAFTKTCMVLKKLIVR